MLAALSISTYVQRQFAVAENISNICLNHLLKDLITNSGHNHSFATKINQVRFFNVVNLANENE